MSPGRAGGAPGGGVGGARRLVVRAGEHREEEQGELSARSPEQGEHWKEEEQGELGAWSPEEGEHWEEERWSPEGEHWEEKRWLPGYRVEDESSKIQEPIPGVAAGRKRTKIH
jgi:hypothetical protein